MKPGKIKKLAALMLCLVTAVSLCSCAGKESITMKDFSAKASTAGLYVEEGNAAAADNLSSVTFGYKFINGRMQNTAYFLPHVGDNLDRYAMLFVFETEDAARENFAKRQVNLEKLADKPSSVSKNNYSSVEGTAQLLGHYYTIICAGSGRP